jgi:hypothetical protein
VKRALTIPCADARVVFVILRQVVQITLTIVLIGVGASAAGAGGSSLNRDVTGTFSGTSVFDITPGCNFFHQTYDAAYTTTRAKVASVDLDGCVTTRSDLPIGAFGYTGTFVLSTTNNAVLTGTVEGVVGNSTSTACGDLFPADLNFTLTVENGTKAYQHASGTISYKGTWCSPQTPSIPGPIFGTLTGNLS